MLPLERQEQLYQLLTTKKSASVSFLCEHLYASPATIRRDLAQMERQGLVRRTHGGAALAEKGGGELSTGTRESRNIAAKKKIGELAACYIKDGDSLFLDPSSTVCHVVPYLATRRQLTAVTNGLHCAMALSAQTTCTTFLPAGQLASRSNSIVGSDAIAFLERYNADIALISCAGFSMEWGATEASAEQARMKSQMFLRARTKILLLDSSKWGTVFCNCICGPEQLDLVITDQDPGPEYRSFFAAQHCEIVWPDP